MQESSPERQDLDPVSAWISQARAGSADALGRLIAHCRNYLLHIADQDMDPALRAREGPSDIVGQTCLEAVRDFPQFQGKSEDDLLGWLRGILRHNLDNATRHHTAAKRRASREVSLDAGGSGAELHERLVADLSSPSSHLQKQEREQQVLEALERLPEDYRQVILWQHREQCSFEEIGRRLGRTSEAARKLWARAVQRLKEELRCGDE